MSRPYININKYPVQVNWPGRGVVAVETWVPKDKQIHGKFYECQGQYFAQFVPFGALVLKPEEAPKVETVVAEMDEDVSLQMIDDSEELVNSTVLDTLLEETKQEVVETEVLPLVAGYEGGRRRRSRR